MFWTQRKNNDFDIGILISLSEDLTTSITTSLLENHRQATSKLNDSNSAPKFIRPFYSRLLMVKTFI